MSKTKSLLLAVRSLSTLCVISVSLAAWSAQRAPQALELNSAEQIAEAEQRLADLGYWTGSVDGVWDSASRQALIAFHKVEGRPRTGRLTAEELSALRAAHRPWPRESGYAHVEVDLPRQVLFIVDERGTVTHILPVSSGNGKLFTAEGQTRRAVTPPGRFTVYHKTDGWRQSPLGWLYYPNYIVGGVAIHGHPSVPVYPASHGCIRIPMFAAPAFSAMTPIGTVVIVYDEPFPAPKKDVLSFPITSLIRFPVKLYSQMEDLFVLEGARV